MKPEGMIGFLPVAAYLDRVASTDPTPGGGAAAAVTAAQGAALLSMVCNLTIGKKRFADVEEEVVSILANTEGARQVMLRLGDRDMQVFEEVMQAYRMPKATAEELERRNKAIQTALKASSEVPFELFLHCIVAFQDADRLEEIGNPSVLSDVHVGRYLLVAAMLSAKANVEVNLDGIDDATFCDKKRKIMESAISGLGEKCRGLVGR